MYARVLVSFATVICYFCLLLPIVTRMFEQCNGTLRAHSRLYRPGFPINLPYPGLLTQFTDYFDKTAIKFSKLLLPVLPFPIPPFSLGTSPCPLDIHPTPSLY